MLRSEQLRKQAKEAPAFTYCGCPIEDLSREELLGLVVEMTKKQAADAQRGRDFMRSLGHCGLGLESMACKN